VIAVDAQHHAQSRQLYMPAIPALAFHHDFLRQTAGDFYRKQINHTARIMMLTDLMATEIIHIRNRGAHRIGNRDLRFKLDLRRNHAVFVGIAGNRRRHTS
jgi:hypothetical protein